MTPWDAFQTVCLMVGYISFVLTIALVATALGYTLREWMTRQDQRHLIDRAERLEDAQVEALDAIWHLPTAGGH